MLGAMLKMLTAAGSRLQLHLKETELVVIAESNRATVKSAAELLSLHALGLLTAHSDATRKRLQPSANVTSSIRDDVIDQLCLPRRLEDQCLSCVRMNCYPNAFVAASKLSLTPMLQESVRPGYQTYNEQFDAYV